MKFRRVVYRQSSTASAPRLHRGGFICSARWIWHLFISRRCYAVYDLRRQAPTTTTTRIPDPRTYLPPVGCPTSFFYPPRLPQERKEKKIRYKFSAFFVTPTLPALSRVPPAVCPSLLESVTTDSVCTSFLQSLSAYVHTAIPHMYILPFCNLFPHTYIRRFHIRTYAEASFHITIQARSTNTRFTYVQSSTFQKASRGVTDLYPS